MATGGSNLKKMSDETFDFVCTSCAEDSLVSEAIKYCIECSKYFCQSCLSLHEKFPTLRGHSFLDSCSATSTSGSKTQLPSFPTEKCKKHKGKIVDMYCGNHDAVGCYACVAMDHTSCKDLHSIPDDINTLYKEEEYKQTTEELLRRLKAMKTIRKRTENQMQDLQTAKVKGIEAIKAYRAQLEAYLDNLEKELITELEAKIKKIEADLQQEKVKFDKIVDDLNGVYDNSNQSGENVAQRFVCGKLAKIKTASKASDRPRGKYASIDISFSPNDQFRASLQQSEGMGSICDNTTLFKSDAYKIAARRDIEIKLPDDKGKCCVIGCCLADDDSLLLADCSNKRLKRVCLTGVSGHCDLSAKPNTVCLVSKTEAAVACSQQSVQFVSLGDKMKPLRVITVSHKCYGIACKDRKLYISNGRKSVFVHTLSGNLVKQIKVDSLGHQIFDYNGQIAFSAFEDTMIVSDDRNGLACFDKNLNRISTVNDSDFKGADGVCVDGRGNVFVVGCYYKNVVQLREDGHKIGVVVKGLDGIRLCPRSVCFSRNKNMMFITIMESNIVKVYELV